MVTPQSLLLWGKTIFLMDFFLSSFLSFSPSTRSNCLHRVWHGIRNAWRFSFGLSENVRTLYATYVMLSSRDEHRSDLSQFIFSNRPCAPNGSVVWHWWPIVRHAAQHERHTTAVAASGTTTENKSVVAGVHDRNRFNVRRRVLRERLSVCFASVSRRPRLVSRSYSGREIQLHGSVADLKESPVVISVSSWIFHLCNQEWCLLIKWIALLFFQYKLTDLNNTIQRWRLTTIEQWHILRYLFLKCKSLFELYLWYQFITFLDNEIHLCFNMLE